jgi:drug/metabolite transporter (DMT)-like permease
MGLVLAFGMLLPSGETLPTARGAGWAVAAGTGGVMGLCCLYLALSRGTMGLVAPLTALVAATVPAILGLAAGEPAGPMLLAGTLVALTAVVVIALPDRRIGTPTVPTFHGSRTAEWALIVIAGLGFAGFFLGADRAHAEGSGTFWTLLLVRIAAVLVACAGTGALLALRRTARPRLPRALVPLALLTATGDTLGNLFYILAVAQGTLSVTVVLASLYPVSTAVLARVVLHERLSAVRLVGVGLAIAGVVLVSLGALGT